MAKYEAGKVNMQPTEKVLRQEAGLYSENNAETLMDFLIKGDKNRSIFQKDKLGDGVEWKQSYQIQNHYKRESFNSLDLLIINPDSPPIHLGNIVLCT